MTAMKHGAAMVLAVAWSASHQAEAADAVSEPSWWYVRAKCCPNWSMAYTRVTRAINRRCW
ncbi:MAG TPA: hypothetical protein VIM98_05995 [Dyella sp.]|uniref:hypothetical protein n=1 Tax=Dyella sp. TaxID=1869338 RepID=UPI002F945B49